MSSPEAARIPIFAALSNKDRDKVLGSAIQRTYASGATLVKEGESALNLFFIASGTAQVVTADGVHRNTLGPGDFFGELGLILRHPRTATVTADGEVTVVMLSAWEFRDLLAEYPQMAVPMVYGLVARLHGIVEHEQDHEHPAADPA
ncbi:MAG TPA: cyclic nucleotide-binding domain-containing protein [Candidatus Limnocylindrales bacterium]|jgi:CRP-like cAMP-binding protein